MILILEFFFSGFIEVPKPKSALPEGLINNKYISYLTPNFKGDFQNKEVSATININSKGLRDKEIEYAKNKEEYRILGLGDSFTFSYTSYQNNFLTILEDSLKTNLNNNINIVKAGVPGIGPDFYYNFYIKEGYKYNPDLILINLYIGNDISNIGELSDFSSVKEDIISINFFYKTKVWLRENSNLYVFIVDRVKGIPTIKKELNDRGIAPDVFEIYNTNPDESLIKKWDQLSLIFDKFKNLNKKVAVVIIPSIYQLDRKQEKTLLSSRVNNNYDVNFPTKNLEKILKNKNIDYLNPLTALQKAQSVKSLIYKTEGHFNSYANLILANEIKDFIILKNLVF